MVVITMRPPAVKVEFDLEANAVYYGLRGGRVAKTTKKRFDSLDVLLDYDGKGRVVGFEVLNMTRGLERYPGIMGLRFIPKTLAAAPQVK